MTTLFTTPTVLAVYPPVEGSTDWYLMVNLLDEFPALDGLANGTDAAGNHDIAAKIAEVLAADRPDVADRVEFDPEYYGTYAYGTADDLAAVITVIRGLAATGWGK